MIRIGNGLYRGGELPGVNQPLNQSWIRAEPSNQLLELIQVKATKCYRSIL